MPITLVVIPTREDLGSYFDTWMRMLYFCETIEGFFSGDEWFRRICDECVVAATDEYGAIWLQYFVEVCYVLVAQYDHELFRVLVDVGSIYQL